MTFTGPVLSSTTSADGPTVVTSVMLLLFAGFESGVPEVLEALLVNGPDPGAVRITGKLVEPPAGNVGMVLVTNVPLGNVSMTTMFVAVEGPAFVTEMMFV